MLTRFYQIYALLFAHPFLRAWHELLFQLSLRGMGVLNYQTAHLAGEAAWLHQYLGRKKQPIVLDVGANEGQYASMVLTANPTARVFSFEPHPRTFQKLLGQIGQDARVTAIPAGVGEEAGQLELFDHADADGSQHASLYRGVIEDLHAQKAVAHLVNIIKLDDFIADQGFMAIDLLKIDTEGHEYKVLLGALKAIQSLRIQAIHLEFNEMNIISKQSFKDFWDLLDAYDFYRILPGGKLLPIRVYKPISCELFAFQNLILILKPKF